MSFAVLRSPEEWGSRFDSNSRAVLSIGNFDGVHRGHAQVIKAAHAARPKVPLAVLTFEPHPREFFAPDSAPPRLSRLRDQLELMAAAAVEEALLADGQRRHSIPCREEPTGEGSPDPGHAVRGKGADRVVDADPVDRDDERRDYDACHEADDYGRVGVDVRAWPRDHDHCPDHPVSHLPYFQSPETP